MYILSFDRRNQLVSNDAHRLIATSSKYFSRYELSRCPTTFGTSTAIDLRLTLAAVIKSGGHEFLWVLCCVALASIARHVHSGRTKLPMRTAAPLSRENILNPIFPALGKVLSSLFLCVQVDVQWRTLQGWEIILARLLYKFLVSSINSYGRNLEIHVVISDMQNIV